VLAKKQLAIAIPASVIADTPHLREKTAKIGLIGRAAAIFRVEEIIVYMDNPRRDQTRDMDLIELLLTYMETPQYLRKRLFPISLDLQYAGILPPLRTAHHPLRGKLSDLKVGDIREGVAISKDNNGTLVDIGSEKTAFLPQQTPLNERVTVRITKLGDDAQIELVDHSRVSEYWGYTVSLVQSLRTLLKSPDFDFIIGTSKFASAFLDLKTKMEPKWKKADDILVLFGSPTHGLREIAKDEGIDLGGEVDYMVNTIPWQGTETVRTEEALLATLAVLNVEFGA
jgi:methyltransferase